MASGPAEIPLDGSAGEGGGQVLRTALCLSLITQTPFHLSRIRDGQEPRGLRPEHLACVRGAEAISSSRSEGAAVSSPELWFRPGPVHPGEFLLEVGSAGSAPLLLQCLFFPLALAGGGRLTVRGATHPPQSPVYSYLAAIWLPAVQAFGFTAELRLLEAGFASQGGGELSAEIGARREPPTLVELPSRGTLTDVDVTSFVVGLPLSVAERQGAAAVGALQRRGIHASCENRPLKSSTSKGTQVFIRAQFENTMAGFTALGDRGQSPEEVGEAAAAQLGAFMQSSGALDAWLGDQLLVPAALLAAGLLGEAKPGRTRFTTQAVTGHLSANAEVIRQFLPGVRLAVDADRGEVRVEPGRDAEGRDPKAGSEVEPPAKH